MTTTASASAASAAAVSQWPTLPLDRLQQQAASAPEGPALILGGPGTGKTHTLLGRTLALLNSGANPYTITVITFSAKGADLLRARLHQMDGIPEGIRNVFIGTLHSYASAFLRQAGAAALGRSPHYTIWDHTQSLETLFDLLSSEDNPLQTSKNELTDILHWHSLNRNRPRENPLPARESRWRQIIAVYETEKAAQNTLDFDDLNTLAVQALEANRQIRNAWSRIRIRHLLVDEFQDVTPGQYRLIKLMTGPTANLCVASDPNQHIYSWRGADGSLLEQFLMDYPAASQHILTVNHRATGHIASLASDLNNSPQMPGLTPDYQRSIRPVGPQAQILRHRGPPPELDSLMLDLVAHLREQEDQAWEDMAFLYRRHRTHSRLVTQMAARDIPYTIQGAGKDEQDPDTVAVFAMLSLLVNPNDMRAFRSAANPEQKTGGRGFNPMAARDIVKISRARQTDLVTAATAALDAVNPATRVYHNLQYLTQAYGDLAAMLDEPDYTVTDICRAAHRRLYEFRRGRAAPFPNPQLSRLFTLSETLSETDGAGGLRPALGRFLERVTAAHHPDFRDFDNDDPYAHQKGITLSTIHAAKGQQWRTVFVTDCTDDVMPGKVDPEDHHRLAEEQRLFYVAATRATDRLYFAAPDNSDRGENKAPCRFLDALPDTVIRIDS